MSNCLELQINRYNNGLNFSVNFVLTAFCLWMKLFVLRSKNFHRVDSSLSENEERITLHNFRPHTKALVWLCHIVIYKCKESDWKVFQSSCIISFGELLKDHFKKWLKFGKMLQQSYWCFKGFFLKAGELNGWSPFSNICIGLQIVANKYIVFYFLLIRLFLKKVLPMSFNDKQ